MRKGLLTSSTSTCMSRSSESMYIAIPSDNAICQTMPFSYQWKYVQLSRLTTPSVRQCHFRISESMYNYPVWQRHLSDNAIFLSVKVCTTIPSDSAICQTMPFSYQWKYVHLSRLTINAICQTLSFSYQRKYVLSKSSDDYSHLQFSEINCVLCELTQSRGHV
jgi:uncharacterized protein YfaA (DUF2138 family)